MKNLRWWSVIGVALASATLFGCGGGGSSSSGELRVINATLTHPSLDVIKISDSTKVFTAVATDTVSAFAGVDSSNLTLQVSDSGVTTALTTKAPSIAGGQHSAMVVYETGGAVNAAFIGEDFTVPATGTANVKLFDAAVDAGPIDVYLTPTSSTADLSTLTPTFSLSPTNVTATAALSISPGTYRVRVTGLGSKTDLRLDVASITLADASVSTVILTPTAGGILVNGSLLVQQAAYSASRNTNARVRVAAGLPSVAGISATVTASAGTAVVSNSLVSPALGSYALVPASTTSIGVSINGAAAVAAPVTLAVGSDTTLLVTGTAAAPTVTALLDDNHLPTTLTSAKVRLVNGMTNSGSATLRVNLGTVASGITAPGASTYGVVTGNLTSLVDLTASGVPAYSLASQPILGNGVYTFFMLGDAGDPTQSNANNTTRTYLLQQDR